MLAHTADRQHARARAFRDRWYEDGGILISTDFVMDETLTLLRMRLGLRAVESWWNQVEGSPRIRWEWIDPMRAERARHWFFRWRDKDFSFTDCSSFAVMKELRITEALTNDEHFMHAGFRVLPAG